MALFSRGRVAVICLLGSMVAACATVPTLDEIMTPYLGRPVADAVNAYGPADVTQSLADGGKAYTWIRYETRIIGPSWGPPEPTVHVSGGKAVSSASPGPYIPPRLVQVPCTLRLEADGQGNITDWKATGPGCYQALRAPAAKNDGPAP